MNLKSNLWKHLFLIFVLFNFVFVQKTFAKECLTDSDCEIGENCSGYDTGDPYAYGECYCDESTKQGCEDCAGGGWGCAGGQVTTPTGETYCPSGQWSCDVGGDGGDGGGCTYSPECGDTHYNCEVGTPSNENQTVSRYLWDCVGSSESCTLECFEDKTITLATSSSCMAVSLSWSTPIIGAKYTVYHNGQSIYSATTSIGTNFITYTEGNPQLSSNSTHEYYVKAEYGNASSTSNIAYVDGCLGLDWLNFSKDPSYEYGTNDLSINYSLMNSDKDYLLEPADCKISVLDSDSGSQVNLFDIESGYSGFNLVGPQTKNLYAKLYCNNEDFHDETIPASTSVSVYNIPTKTLSVSKSGSGSGVITSSPSGIDCGSDCEADYDINTPVTLTAVPSIDSSFSSWSNGANSYTGSSYSVTMDIDKNIEGEFNLIPPPQPSIEFNLDGVEDICDISYIPLVIYEIDNTLILNLYSTTTNSSSVPSSYEFLYSTNSVSPMFYKDYIFPLGKYRHYTAELCNGSVCSERSADLSIFIPADCGGNSQTLSSSSASCFPMQNGSNRVFVNRQMQWDMGTTTSGIAIPANATTQWTDLNLFSTTTQSSSILNYLYTTVGTKIINATSTWTAGTIDYTATCSTTVNVVGGGDIIQEI